MASWQLARQVEDHVPDLRGWWTALGIREATLYAVGMTELSSPAWMDRARDAAPTRSQAQARIAATCETEARVRSALTATDPADRLARWFYDPDQTRAWLRADCLRDEAGHDVPALDTTGWDLVANPVGVLRRFDVGRVWTSHALDASVDLIADYAAAVDALETARSAEPVHGAPPR